MKCIPQKCKVPCPVAKGQMEMPSGGRRSKEFLISFQPHSEWGQGRGEWTRDVLDVTFRIVTLGDSVAGTLRAEGSGMVCSHPSGQSLKPLRDHSTTCHCFPENTACDQMGF